MAEVVKVQTKLSVLFGANDLAKLIHETRLTVRSETHHLSFVAVMRKPEKLCRSSVDNSGRVGILDLAQHLKRVPFTLCPHGRDEVAEAVDRQQCRAFKRRDEEATGKVCAVVFDVVKPRTQTFFRDAEHARQFILQVAHSRGVAEPILDLMSCETRDARGGKQDLFVQVC